MTSQDKLSALLQNKTKVQIQDTLLLFPKKFNLIARIEDIMPRQWHFYTFIFTYQNQFLHNVAK